MSQRPKSSSADLTFRCISAACATLFLSFSAHSMDLLQAYEAAQRNDASVLAARASTSADLESLPQARAQFLPNLNASASRTNNRLESVSPNFLGVDKATQTEYPSGTQTVTVRQPLYRPQLVAQYRQAQAQADDAQASLQQEEQNLVVRVSSAYFDAMLAHDQLALVLAQQKTYLAQVDLARKSFAAGSGTRTDVDEAKARLDLNYALETETRQNVSYTLQQLQSMVVEPIDRLATLNVASFQSAPMQPNSLEEWTIRAESLSPQLQSLAARVRVARQEVDKANSGHFPTLDAIAQWSQSKSESVTNTASNYTNNTIGLQLNIPLYAGGYVNSLVRQALNRQVRAEQLHEAGRRDLGSRVYKEFRGVSEGIARINALEQALRSSEQLVLSSRKSFEAGSRTVLDILNAEQQRVAVMRDLAQARYTFLISKIRLLALVGGADAESVKSINLYLQP